MPNILFKWQLPTYCKYLRLLWNVKVYNASKQEYRFLNSSNAEVGKAYWKLQFKRLFLPIKLVLIGGEYLTTEHVLTK